MDFTHWNLVLQLLSMEANFDHDLAMNDHHNHYYTLSSPLLLALFPIKLPMVNNIVFDDFDKTMLISKGKKHACNSMEDLQQALVEVPNLVL